MRLLPTVLLLFFCISTFSQEVEERRTVTTTYIPLRAFKKLNKELTPQDSLNFKFHNGDTLVKMPENYTVEVDKGKFELNYEYKTPQFLNIYKEVVYWRDKQCSRFWEEDLKLFIDPSIPQKHQKALRDFALGLSTAVDSLTIFEVQKKEEANFHVYYTGSKDTINYEPGLKGKKSDYYLYWNNRQRLTRGFAKVDTDSITNPVYQLANLKYQFFKSLGMFSSSRKIKCAGYLSNCPRIRNLTEMDMEILKYHYSYGIPHGVDKNGFEKFQREIPAIYREDPNAKIYITPAQ